MIKLQVEPTNKKIKIFFKIKLKNCLTLFYFRGNIILSNERSAKQYIMNIVMRKQRRKLLETRNVNGRKIHSL